MAPNQNEKKTKKNKKASLTSRLLCCSKQSGLNVLGANCSWCQKTKLWWFVSSLKRSILPWFSSCCGPSGYRLEAIITLILVTSSIPLQDQTSQVKCNSLINHRCSPLDLSRGLFDHSVVFHIQISVKLKLHFTRLAGWVFNLSH